MLISYTNVAWQHRNTMGVVVDDETLVCGSAAPSIGFLKGSTYVNCLLWGFANAQEVKIIFPKKEKNHVV